MDGVVRIPSAFSMTFGALPSMTATQEFVVPRSIPMTLAMVLLPLFSVAGRAGPNGALVSDPLINLKSARCCPGLSRRVVPRVRRHVTAPRQPTQGTDQRA